MADVFRGFVYTCTFPKDGFTSLSGDQEVVVLIPDFGKGESLVALVPKGRNRVPDPEHVYTVVTTKLTPLQIPIEESFVKSASQKLAGRISRGK
jgi:hypothetical protein